MTTDKEISSAILHAARTAVPPPADADEQPMYAVIAYNNIWWKTPDLIAAHREASRLLLRHTSSAEVCVLMPDGSSHWLTRAETCEAALDLFRRLHPAEARWLRDLGDSLDGVDWETEVAMDMALRRRTVALDRLMAPVRHQAEMRGL